MQSRKDSFVEAATNTVVGSLVSWVITISTMLAVDNKWIASVVTVVLCTAWSLARGYWLRRYFNARTG